VKPLRIATRGSELARAQAGQVALSLEKALGVATELVIVRTSGDRIQDRPLSEVGGKGLFVKEIEEALLRGDADVAVHSGKDLPAQLAAGLELAAFPPRGDARDALIGRRAGATLAGLPPGARIGTGSVRRRAQLLRARPDLEVVPLRGNVDTRLRKLEEESLDAVVLACAGLARLGLEARIDERLDPDVMVPAVAQGTLALEVRAGEALAADLAAVDDAATRAVTGAERAFLTTLAGDCNVPLGAYGTLDGDNLTLTAVLLAPDGSLELRARSSGPKHTGTALGREAAAAVLEDGGRALLAGLGVRVPTP
jgi:hydroxymethylbilane synthase